MIRCKYRHGLSLVEILVVVAVISILATILIGIASRIDNQAKEQGLEATFVLLESALQEYHDAVSRFPEQPEKNSANALIHSEYLYKELNLLPESRIILEKVPNKQIRNGYGAADTPPEIYDPWDTVLDYWHVHGGGFPELISAGPDKIFGTADDISSK
jgi:prepilin-type N-terminal cleavage/methylation domain-containing protein